MSVTKIVAVAVLVAATCNIAEAHFPWLVVDQEGRAQYFFGETPADRSYKMPESIANVKVFSMVDGRRTDELKLEKQEGDDFIGLQSAGPVDRDATLTSAVSYGVYSGSKLQYYTIYQGKLDNAEAENAANPYPQDFKARATRSGEGVDVHVTFKNQPLANAEVKLFNSEGKEQAKAKTDKQGKVTFGADDVAKGLNAVLVGHKVDSKGEVDGQAHGSESHYLTLTFELAR